MTAFPPAAIRKAREEGRSIFGPVQTVESARERRIPGPAGELRLRVLVPDAVRGVYLHLHGGGWTLGAANQSDLRNQAIARHCGLATVSVEYRLAPEHPYPAGPDDCEAAALWLARSAAAEFGTTRLWIGGESAGAHLAVLTLLRLRDRHGLAPFAGANLVYGCYDLSMTPSQRRWGERNLVLSTPIIQWFADFFVPDPARRRDPDVSPLYADLAGMPPALFTRRHARPAARRLALPPRALDRGRRPRRARRLARRHPRLRRLPDPALARGARAHGGVPGRLSARRDEVSSGISRAIQASSASATKRCPSGLG